MVRLANCPGASVVAPQAKLPSASTTSHMIPIYAPPTPFSIQLPAYGKEPTDWSSQDCWLSKR